MKKKNNNIESVDNKDIDEKLKETLEKAVKLLEEINEVLHLGRGEWKL